jgi:hypothetical protein
MATGGHESERHRRQIADRRAELAQSLASARGALRENTGGRLLGSWTGPLLAAGLGLVAAVSIRRFLRR